MGRKEEALGGCPGGALSPVYTDGVVAGTEASRPLPPGSPDISPEPWLEALHPLGPRAAPVP